MAVRDVVAEQDALLAEVLGPEPLLLEDLLSRRIFQARCELHLSNDQLAARLGVSRQTIWRYESNGAAVRAVDLVRLAEVLHKPLDWFFAGGVLPVSLKKPGRTLPHQAGGSQGEKPPK